MTSLAALHTPLEQLTRDPRRGARATHVERIPSRPAVTGDWPSWVDPRVESALTSHGVARPWSHQSTAADLAWHGHHVVVATGTASGKSLAYLLPAATAALGEGATTLYLAPTKALAGDQLRAIARWEIPGLRTATYDGDASLEERDWARNHADIVLTNPDMLHHVLLPGHSRWASWLRRLRYVVVDECHGYRGVFGSHVAAVLRRLRRIAVHHGAQPTFVLASATTAQPGASAARLIGTAVQEVVADGSPHAAVDFVLWEPPLLPVDDATTTVRRTATAEAADLLADLVAGGVRTVAFVRSRRGAESVALGARRGLAEAAPELVDAVAAYRAGYLAEDRRDLEAALHSGRLLGLASTNALELGIDVSGLDAVLITGWPGTRASVWQQAGRAGRNGRDALAVLIARDDPLDTYLVHHPDALFGQPVEATVLDPDNGCVLRPHLAAAAAELPLTEADLSVFGPAATEAVDDLVADGLLRRRHSGWYWTSRDRASDLADLRGTGGAPVAICELGTGRLLGTAEPGSAHTALHTGAVYVHQGETYLVDRLDLDDAVALVQPARPDWTTHARELTDIAVVSTDAIALHGHVTLHHGVVDVTNQVVGYLKRRLGSGEVIGEEPLDLPCRQLRTKAVWWTVTNRLVQRADISPNQLPGAAHAAEHACIGLLPLVATCDRWDVGGVSTAAHPDTDLPSVFVYDGHPGGAGFAERGFDRAWQWLTATRDTIRGCGCDTGCPACVHSPKCGNGNEPLDKAAALRLLSAVLDDW